MESKKMVMIPGPTPVVKSIQDAMGREMQAFGDPRFVKDYKKLIDDMARLLNCSGKTFVIAGTGTLAMEMAISNVSKRGEKVLVASNGFFGDRFVDICKRKGLETDVIQAEWGTTVTTDQIRDRLKAQNHNVLIVSHVDTATGVCAPVKEIGEMLKEFPETIFIVDGVCATAGEFEDVDGMNIDVLFTGTQKAFGVCPGLLMLWASKKALAKRASLGIIPEYYVDFDKWIPVMDDPSKYFATPAVNLVWALAESVRLIEEEGGLLARDARHRKHARAMQQGFEAIGLTVLAKPECRAVTLSNLVYPEGVNDAEFRKFMYEEGAVVAGGLAAYAGRMFRMGHMGNVDTNDLVAAMSTVERALFRAGKHTQLGLGVSTYLNALVK